MPNKEGYIRIEFILKEGSELAQFARIHTGKNPDSSEKPMSIHEVCKQLAKIGQVCLTEHQSEGVEQPATREQQLRIMRKNYHQICN